MSGKCFACSSAFGFFKKEHGCKNCGFAFCSSCLPHKEPVPKHNNQRLPVCINCHLILTGYVYIYMYIYVYVCLI
ncbi:hypothetical protein CAPTEDRAFT_141529 [Capitella teleta]|uniref:FYVE-type domain-containing protein n=1 Tax=Capitella teleta TaxID=283909 RepID=R7UWK0_CAPTE|nr:hypothetical protein CAPTEDRAFT_141529 [Capitella teleta]|eukprot:ELU10647.1 hypothetical protein CAPTEDRAFT_141529 [Capitella teleta]